MSNHAIFLILAFLFLGLVFIVPQLIDLRIRVLNWLRWNSLANWFERNKAVIILPVRVLLVILSLVMFALAAA